MTSDQLLCLIKQLIAVIVGLIITIILSRFITPILMNLSVRDVNKEPPPGIEKELWNSVIEPTKSGGEILGTLETIFFFLSLWIAHPELIAGWLVFKVGSKWEVWSNLVKVPEKMDMTDEINYLRARHDWGTAVLTRFLVGTISNILLAMIGTAICFGVQQLLFML